MCSIFWKSITFSTFRTFKLWCSYGCWIRNIICTFFQYEFFHINFIPTRIVGRLQSVKNLSFVRSTVFHQIKTYFPFNLIHLRCVKLTILDLLDTNVINSRIPRWTSLNTLIVIQKVPLLTKNTCLLTFCLTNLTMTNFLLTQIHISAFQIWVITYLSFKIINVFKGTFCIETFYFTSCC